MPLDIPPQGELTSLGRWVNKITPEMEMAEAITAGKAFSEANIDKGLHNAFLRMLANPGSKEHQKAFEDAIEKVGGWDSVQGKFIKSFTQSCGASTQAAVFQSTRDKGFIDGKTWVDEGIRSQYSLTELYQGGMAEKRRDNIERSLDQYSGADLMKLNDDALDYRYTGLDIQKLAETRKETLEGFFNDPRLSDFKKDQIGKLYADASSDYAARAREAAAESHQFSAHAAQAQAEDRDSTQYLERAAQARSEAAKYQDLAIRLEQKAKFMRGLRGNKQTREELRETEENMPQSSQAEESADRPRSNKPRKTRRIF